MKREIGGNWPLTSSTMGCEGVTDVVGGCQVFLLKKVNGWKGFLGVTKNGYCLEKTKKTCYVERYPSYRV